jgi:hypothetical protein
MNEIYLALTLFIIWGGLILLEYALDPRTKEE